MPFLNPIPLRARKIADSKKRSFMLEAKLSFKTSYFACFQTKRVGTSMSTNVSPLSKVALVFFWPSCDLKVVSRHGFTSSCKS